MGDRLCSPDDWMPPPPPPPAAHQIGTMRLVQAEDISYPRSETCPVHSPHRLRMANGTPFRCSTPRTIVCHHHCCHHLHHQPVRKCISSSQVFALFRCPMSLGRVLESGVRWGQLETPAGIAVVDRRIH